MKLKIKRRIVKVQKRYAWVISFIARFRKTFICATILLFGLPIFYLPTEVDDWGFYNDTIGSDYYQEEWRPTIDQWLGGSLRMFVRDVFENSGYRSPERTMLHVNAEMEHGHTLDQMNIIISRVEDYLQTVPGIEKFVTEVYSGQNAHVTIYFDAKEENSSLPYQLKNKLISKALDWGGVEWDIYGVGKGYSNSTGGETPRFRVEFRGYNYHEVSKQSEILASKLLSHKRIQKVNTNEKLNYWEKPSSQYVLTFDKHQLALSQIGIPDVVESIQERAKPNFAQTYLSLEDKITPVMLIEKNAETFSKYHLMQESMASAKISNLGSIQLETTSNSISKEDRMYIRVLSFDYFGSQHFGEHFLDEKLEEMTAEMPAGYSVKKLTFEWDFDKIKRQYSLLLILIVVIYFICAILFENLTQPFIIILTIPISFIGLFLTFSLFDFYFDQGGYAAFLLLGGLVVNASIFVLSEFNHLKNRDLNKRLIRALSSKAKPILLTILSTIFGLAPFLMEGDQEVFWFSLAIGTIGGLVFSLLAVFVFLPVVLWKKTIHSKNQPFSTIA